MLYTAYTYIHLISNLIAPARFMRSSPYIQVLIDDCHGTGVLGRTGRGTLEYCGVEDGQVDGLKCEIVINSTLGKALGKYTSHTYMCVYIDIVIFLCV